MTSDDITDDADDQKSRSQRKREADAVREFAARLVHTPAQKLKRLPLSDQLRQALADCPPPSTRGAHKRHIQYISKLIRRNDDAQSLQKLLDAPTTVVNPHAEFCDQLILSFTAQADTLRQRYPAVSIQQARQLATTAAKATAEALEEDEQQMLHKKKAEKARKNLLKLLTEAAVGD